MIVWPVVDAILFGAIGVYFGEQAADGGAGGAAAGAAFLLAGIILFHVVFQAEVSVATGFLEETWSRNLLNLMVTPMTELEYGAGVALFGLVKLAIGVTAVSLVALAAFAFQITSLGFALIPLVAILIVVGWAVALDRDRADPALRPGRGDPHVGLHRAAAAAVGDLLPGRRAAGGAAARSPRCCRRPMSSRPRRRWSPATRCRGTRSASPPPAPSCSRRSPVWFLTYMLAKFRSRGYINRHV